MSELSIAILLLLEEPQAIRKQDAIDEDVLDRGEFTRRMEALALALAALLRTRETAAARRLTRLLDRDWATMSARERGVALRVASGELRRIPFSVSGQLQDRVTDAALVMERRARVAARRQHKLDVSADVPPTQEAMAIRLALPTSAFVAEEYQRRGVAFAGAAAIAIGVGLRNGESSADISARVQGRATAALGRDAYLRGVAGAVLNRARTNSLLTVFREAGAQNIQVLSVRDEKTCEKCLLMDGTVLPVNGAFDLMAEVARQRTPASVARVNPFLREGVDASGNRIVYVPGSDGARLTLATVVRSRQGQVDRVSEFDRTPSATELLALGVGLPPYHPICRCVVVIA